MRIIFLLLFLCSCNKRITVGVRYMEGAKAWECIIMSDNFSTFVFKTMEEANSYCQQALNGGGE